MAIYIIIIILVLIGLFLLLILKKIIRLALILSGIMILILIIAGFVLIHDSQKLQSGLQEQNIYLFESGNSIVAGLITVPNSDEPELLDSAELSKYNSYFKEQEFKKIKGDDNYIMFIFSKESFDSVKNLEIENHQYSKDFVFSLIDSGSPVQMYVSDLASKENLNEEQKNNIISDFVYTDAEFRGYLFNALFSKSSELIGPVFIFKEYKKGNVIVYRESPIFTFIDMIPTAFLSNIVKDTKIKITEKLT